MEKEHFSPRVPRDVRTLSEELEWKILAQGGWKTIQDKKHIAAFAYCVAKREYFAEMAVTAEEPDNQLKYFKLEAQAAQELRAWAEKRKNLFGDEQGYRVESDEDRKQKEHLAGLKNLTAK